MNKIRFGTGGIPHSTKIITTPDGKKLSGNESAILRLKKLNLDHFELEFVHGVNISEETARSISLIAKREAITLSAHGSYYINLASKEKPKYYASINRVKKTINMAHHFEAKSITFHPAFLQERSHKEVANIVTKALVDICREYYNSDKNKSIPLISPETTGKISQWGSLEDILQVADTVNQKIGQFYVSICIDFAHLHARSNGQMNTYGEFTKVIKQVKDVLGAESINNLHMHTSGINYNEKGERNHLNLEESDFNYKDLLKALHDTKVSGYLVCESPNLEDDAQLMKNYYEKEILKIT